MAASADHGESYCVQEEIELLEAIFIHELTVKESFERELSLSITLHPSTGDEEHKKFVCLTLDIELPHEYPSVLPSIVIRSPRGLSEAHVNSISDNLQELAREQIGGPMLYELIQYAKDSLTDNNIPSCECAICLSHFQDSDSFTRTQCYHFFHCSCLARFIEFSQEQEDKEEIECPVCRLLITFDLESLKAAPVADTEQIEFNYKPSDEIKELQSKMAAVYEEQKRKGGIIDVDQERNKFLIDISSTPTQSTEQEPSESVLVSQQHSDEAVISDVRSPQTKAQEDLGTKEKNQNSVENLGRKKLRQQNASKSSSRNSPRYTKKYFPERACLDQRNVKDDQKQSSDTKLQVEKSKKEKDLSVNNYKNNDDIDKGQHDQNKNENVNDSRKSEKPIINSKKVLVNNPTKASKDIEGRSSLSETSLPRGKVTEAATKGDSKKSSEERKNDFKSNKKQPTDEIICSGPEQTSGSFKLSNEIKICSVVETPDKEKCMSEKAKMVVEESKANHSSGRRRRERRKNNYTNKDVSRTDKSDEMKKQIPKEDHKKETARSIRDGISSPQERDQMTKRKFDGRQRNNSQQTEKERKTSGKPRQAWSEGSDKELKDLNRCPTNNNKERLSEDCKKESVKEDWPDLKSDAQTQRTRDKWYSEKKQSRKSKNLQERQDTKSQPHMESVTQAECSDVAKLGLSSTSRAASKSSGKKSDAKHHHERIQDKRHTKEKILQVMKESVDAISKSEIREQYNEMGGLGVKPPPGFEGKRLKSGGCKPPPGFEDKAFEKPVGWNPPPGFENLGLKAKTTEETKTHQR